MQGYSKINQTTMCSFMVDPLYQGLRWGMNSPMLNRMNH